MQYLTSKNFPSASPEQEHQLTAALDKIMAQDYQGSFFKLFSTYKKILGDNNRKAEWEAINDKLSTLLKCGKTAPIDGPMIGVSISIRDFDYFKESAQLFGHNRSIVANIEWMASIWNNTFASTGIWMGKTFEPVDKAIAAKKCDNNPLFMDRFNPETTRIGRNFFREPLSPDCIQSAGVPVLTKLWGLKDRPTDVQAQDFNSVLLEKNLALEKSIPYIKTGGYFLAETGTSVAPKMNGKAVYQLNYRWPGLEPVYPMTRLIDELVQVDEGIYLGQLIMATHHYSLGSKTFSLFGEDFTGNLGETYHPAPDNKAGLLGELKQLWEHTHDTDDYGYQNNGYFLMIDPKFAKQAYADDGFPQLRPTPGETGYLELAYDKTVKTPTPSSHDESVAWQKNEALAKKFTTFCTEPSPLADDGDAHSLLQPGESILQMLQRIQTEINAQTKHDDHLKHFEKLNRLFRSGVAPTVKDGLFQGSGKGYNTRYDGLTDRQWYGQAEPLIGFDYYHGATLNLHWGFADNFHPETTTEMDPSLLFPTSIATLLKEGRQEPALLNQAWQTIGRFIFPWAGKSFEKVSGRKLSMLLDESDNLRDRYPARTKELHDHPASWPHYDLVLKNEAYYWPKEGPLMAHLKSGAWDLGMSAADKSFWDNEAKQHWIFGNNIQDSRILAADGLFRALDMNYRTPEQALLNLAESGPSPFVRQGYCFLGLADQQSILPMNNGPDQKKRVFQFHYRYPMIGGAAPIGTCLDELVEIAEGLYLGQLIYSTSLLTPFHSSVDPANYKYQLFGYFLLLDNDWESHRQAIKLDTWR
ncbi:MAG: hypothetical protein NTV43_08600 [Methylococcales bacterium]|nr:hypothetical protein [Methylococcales bacterium]